MHRPGIRSRWCRRSGLGFVAVLLVCSACDDRGGTFSGTLRLGETGELLRAGTVEFYFDADGRIDGNETISVVLTEQNAICRSGAEFDSIVAETMTDGDPVEVTLTSDSEILVSMPPEYGASEAVFDC